MKKDVFGTKGDFITSPEISQMFDLKFLKCLERLVLRNTVIVFINMIYLVIYYIVLPVGDICLYIMLYYILFLVARSLDCFRMAKPWFQQPPSHHRVRAW